MVVCTFSAPNLVACHSVYQVHFPSLSLQRWVKVCLTLNIGLVKPVRAVTFSPGGKFLAAAGDSKVIILYDTSSGEQVASLTGHSAWILSLSWSYTGEYLLSG